jgi:hypothetical protein
MCKRAFINEAQGKEICPECAERLNELYPVVRSFLRNHDRKVFTIREVSQILNIDIRDVEGLVTMGLINSSQSLGGAEPQKILKYRPSDAPAAASQEKMQSFLHTYHKKQGKTGGT